VRDFDEHWVGVAPVPLNEPDAKRHRFENCGSKKGIRKLTPKGCPAVAHSVAAMSAERSSAEAVSIPRPPAFETAAASSGVEAAPIPACWMGTSQPTSSVNAVAMVIGFDLSTASCQPPSFCGPAGAVPADQNVKDGSP